jgi:hypothetical protein
MLNARVLTSGLACSIALSLVIASCGGGAASPSTAATAPTVSTPTVSSVTVACGTGTLTIQCAATARLSDGTTPTVTSQATWTSASNAIATVNSAGLVTAVSTGTTTITATYQGVVGNASASVTKTVPTFNLAGTVTDATSRGPLPNITMEAIDASGFAQTAKTDGSGAYTLTGLAAASYTLTASATGYQATSRGVTLSANTQSDFVLSRIPATPPSPTPSPTSSLMCNGATVPATVSCPNNQGIQPPTAECNDATFSCSQNRSGTCSTHQGVKCYVCPGTLCG